MAQAGRSLNVPCGTQEEDHGWPGSRIQNSNFLFTCLKCPQIFVTKPFHHRLCLELLRDPPSNAAGVTQLETQLETQLDMVAAEGTGLAQNHPRVLQVPLGSPPCPDSRAGGNGSFSVLEPLLLQNIQNNTVTKGVHGEM